MDLLHRAPAWCKVAGTMDLDDDPPVSKLRLAITGTIVAIIAIGFVLTAGWSDFSTLNRIFGR
jgi:hypothetical protein